MNIKKVIGRAPLPDEVNQLVALFNARRYAELESRAHMLIRRYPDSGFAWKLHGASLQMQGKNALAAFQKTAALMPGDAEAHFNLAVVQKSLGLLEDAAASYRRALQLNHAYAEAHDNLGNVLKDLGQLDLAVASYRRALQIKPGSAITLNNLGTALKNLGQLDDALASYQRALLLNPGYAEAHSNLGNALKELGKLDDALASFRRAVQLKPDSAPAHFNFGNALRDIANLDEAMASYRRALEIKPDYAEAHSNLGSTLKDLGRLDEAMASYRRALEIKPDYTDAYYNLGNVLKDLGQLAEAAASYRRALDIKPDFVDAHNNLGATLKDLGQLDEAAASYRRALDIKPDFVDAHNNLGAALKDLGQLAEAVASYRQALELQPDYTTAQSSLLFILNYSAIYSPEYYLDEARRYGLMVSSKVSARFSSWQSVNQPNQLRVGMVSGDLRNHAVGFFLDSLLAHVDPARIELFAYPTQPKEDELTARIRPVFSQWKPLYGKSDEDAARLIHADGIHILLDLSGHSRHGRLPVFAWKPAPVQTAWLGYFATTGVTEIDYLLADPVGVPEAHREHFTETVWYLPDTRLCFSPPETGLPVAPLPSQQSGRVTFGCFQNMAKVDDVVLATWASILAALPDARLRWQCYQLGDPAVIKRLIPRLQQQGIDPAKVTLQSSVAREVYLAAHSEVDLILDTFPYPGGTTTCEALWMGVPTLTLAGDTLLSRQGASLLTAAGLEDWIATSREEYVDRAIALAGDLPKLATLRAGLRQQVAASPLFDAPRFARNFEDALWGMWQTHDRKSGT